MNTFDVFALQVIIFTSSRRARDFWTTRRASILPFTVRILLAADVSPSGTTCTAVPRVSHQHQPFVYRNCIIIIEFSWLFYLLFMNWLLFIELSLSIDHYWFDCFIYYFF